MPRDQIVQDQCLQISGAGLGRADLVARRVARLSENATTLTCFAENFFVILLATSQPVKKTKTKMLPIWQCPEHTQNHNRLQTIDTMFSRISRKINSTAPRCPRLLRARFFLTLQASVRHMTNTHSQCDKTDVTNFLLFNMNTKLNACQSSHVLRFLTCC